MVDEGLLQRMQRPIPRKGFDRRDLRALVHDRKGQAGIDAPPIEEHGAGAALALIAALLRAGQVEVQHVQQRGA